MRTKSFNEIAAQYSRIQENLKSRMDGWGGRYQYSGK